MKKVIRLTESDLIKIVKKVISESEESSPDISPANGCTTLKICQGKTFKSNSLDRLTELYLFIEELDMTINGFKLTNKGGIDNIYPPAPAPTNSPYNPGTKVSWVFKNKNNPILNIYVWQRNECIKSCPQIYLQYKGKFEQYSILDDSDFSRLKNNLSKYFSESKIAS